MRIERRLTQPWWLSVAVPAASLALAFGISSLVLLVTGHDPLHTWSRLLDSAFFANGALSATIVAAIPLCFTGLAAAAAFRMGLFNIGGEGQLYMGAIGAAAAGIALGGAPMAVAILAMVAAGCAAGAAWALVPGVLRAFLSTNEIITSLMLNYVAALILNFLIFDSHSYWRDTSTAEARVFPQGKQLPDAAVWPFASFPHAVSGGLLLPLGAGLALLAALLLAVLYSRTRFGFEVQVIGDSPRAARYAGMRTRRKILAVMAISGALAGLGGASQDGDVRHLLDPRGLSAAGYGYSGIVVAALARYNPFAVVVIAFLLGGLQNAGYTLQGADFPSGLVGMIQGIILFCALGCELLVRYRIRFGSRARTGTVPVTEVSRA
jgi:general nucleoside transport system permease protein